MSLCGVGMNLHECKSCFVSLELSEDGKKQQIGNMKLLSDALGFNPNDMIEYIACKLETKYYLEQIVGHCHYYLKGTDRTPEQLQQLIMDYIWLYLTCHECKSREVSFWPLTPGPDDFDGGTRKYCESCKCKDKIPKDDWFAKKIERKFLEIVEYKLRFDPTSENYIHKKSFWLV